MKWLLVCTAVFIGVFAVECALEIRQWRDGRAWLKQQKPYYSFSLHANDSQLVSPLQGLLKLKLEPGMVYTNFPGQSTPYFAIDRSGFRGPGIDAERGRLRIVVVGGSTAFGTGLDADDETFAAHLEELLPGSEVINAAVIGHSSGQELVRIVTELVDLEPRLVVALDGVNDAMTSEFESVRSYGGGFNGTTGMLENPLQDLVVFTDPNPFWRLAVGLPRLLFPQLTDTLFPWFPPSDHVSGHQAAGIYVRNVTKMQRFLSAYDVRFLCAIQPFLVSKYTGFGNLPERFPILRSVAAKRFEAEGVAFVDLNGEPGLSPEMFLDSMHLDSRGYEVLARRVSDVIAQRGLLSGDRMPHAPDGSRAPTSPPAAR